MLSRVAQPLIALLRFAFFKNGDTLPWLESLKIATHGLINVVLSSNCWLLVLHIFVYYFYRFFNIPLLNGVRRGCLFCICLVARLLMLLCLLGGVIKGLFDKVPLGDAFLEFYLRIEEWVW